MHRQTDNMPLPEGQVVEAARPILRHVPLTWFIGILALGIAHAVNSYIQQQEVIKTQVAIDKRMTEMGAEIRQLNASAQRFEVDRATTTLHMEDFRRRILDLEQRAGKR